MTNEKLYEELMYQASDLGILEQVRAEWDKESQRQFPESGPRDSGDRVSILQEIIKNIKEKMSKYKIQIIPLNTTPTKQELPYVVEFETSNIEWTMEQYQRSRQPFEWKVLE